MVVYDDDRTAIARLATDEPLSTALIDGAASVLLLNGSADVIPIQVAFVEATAGMFGPHKTNDLSLAGPPVST